VHADVELVDGPDTKHRVWNAGIFAFDPTMFWGTPDNPDFLLLRLAPTAATIMEHTEHGPARRRWTPHTA
jgi:general stress protein 26